MSTENSYFIQTRDRQSETGEQSGDIQFLSDIPMEISVEFGGSEFTVRRILGWQVGDVLTLDQPEGTPLRVRINGRTVGHGEAVVVNDHYGLRVTGIRDPELD